MSAQAPRLAARAPGKVNLCLYLGPTRSDARHELVSVVQSVSLADELVLARAPGDGGEDVVVCPGVDGPNLAADALAAFRRRTGWDGPAQRLHIDKRVPIAGGMGGGSGDAAAALRLAAAGAGVEDQGLLLELAAGLGADVPAQVRPGRWLVQGAGERLQRLDDLALPGLLVVPGEAELSAGAVYAEADRLGLGRSSTGLAQARRAVERGLEGEPEGGFGLPEELLANELQPAALSLAPQIAELLEQVRAAGAPKAMVSGSGPTVLGLFPGASGYARAQEALARLGRTRARAAVAAPVGEAFARVRALD